MLHLGITNIQLRYVLVFTMCANLLVMRLFEVATSLRYWNNSDCICCYPPGTCYPNETGFWQPYSGCKSHKTRPIGLCWWFFRDPDTPTHTHTSCSHLNTSKIALQKMRTNSYKYRKSTESTDMRTIRQSTVSKPIEGVYIYILVICFDRAILRFLGLQQGFRQPDFSVGRDMCEKQSPKEHLESWDPWV